MPLDTQVQMAAQMNTPMSSGMKGTPIIDGFTYNSRVMHVSSYFHSALAQMEPLRRANGYRPRIFGVPTPDDRPVQAYESVEYQVAVQPGAFLWGLQFWALTTDTRTASPPIYCYRIVDACTELPLQDRPVFTTAAANANVPTHGLVTDGTAACLGQNLGPVLLPQPYLINAPGTLNVEITNGGPSIAQLQFLLLIAEPCINEKELEKLSSRVRRIR
jgi:hypothetical protein